MGEHAQSLIQQSESGMTPIATGLTTICSTDIRASGDGQTIVYGPCRTRFGTAWLAIADNRLCRLDFLDDHQDDSLTIAALRQQWPQASVTLDHAAVQRWGDVLQRAIAHERSVPISLLAQGTSFQLRVWQALMAVPWGEVTTYQDLASAIGQPEAVRAVGTAVGRNPIAYLIPCHRVVRKTGELGGYRWGRSRKAAMLEWEATQRHQDADYR